MFQLSFKRDQEKKEVEEYNEYLNELMRYLAKHPQTKNMRDENNIASVIFQFKYDLMDLKSGEKILFPVGLSQTHDMESDLLFTNAIKNTKKNKKNEK